MSSITKKAVRLAVFVDLVSCLGMIFQTEPYGFWDKVCESIGWSPFAVSHVLVSFFFLLHFPVAFLSWHIFGSMGFEVYNGRLVFSGPLSLLIILLQCALWSFIFLGLLHLEKRARSLFRRHVA